MRLSSMAMPARALLIVMYMVWNILILFNLGLSFYEVIAAPRMISDINQVSISRDQLDMVINETLRCNICLEIYTEPVNIKNCLHKFCRRCIEEYNRKFKKECALCRHSIETRRHMRDDNILKNISKSSSY